MVKAALSVPLWKDHLFLSGEEEFLSGRTTIKGYEVNAHALTNLPVLVFGFALLGREGLSFGRVIEVTRNEQGSRDRRSS